MVERRAVEVRVGDLGEHARDEAVADRLEARGLGRHLRRHDVGGGGHAGDRGDVLRARAQAALLAAAEQHRREGDSLAQVEHAETARPVDVVRRQREHADGGLAHVDGDETLGGDRVAVEHDAGAGQRLGDLGDRLDRADLVARPADGHEDRLVGDAGAQLLGRHAPVQVDRQAGDAKAVLLEVLGDVQDGDVFGLGDDDVVALAPVAHGVADQGEVVRLGRARGEDDLGRLGADEAGDAGAGLLEGGRGRVADAVQRRGVAEVLREVGQHGLDDPRVDGLGGLVVGVDDAGRAHGRNGVRRLRGAHHDTGLRTTSWRRRRAPGR